MDDCGVFEQIPRDHFFPTLQDALVITKPRANQSINPQPREEQMTLAGLS